MEAQKNVNLIGPKLILPSLITLEQQFVIGSKATGPRQCAKQRKSRLNPKPSISGHKFTGEPKKYIFLKR